MTSAIPPSIDAALMALSGSSGYSPSLRKGLDRIALYVMRAFGTSLPDSATIAKALTKGRECLALATAPSASSADTGTVPHLTLLLAELQAQMDLRPTNPVSPAVVVRPASRPDPDVRFNAAAVSPPPTESVDAPRYVGLPTQTLARTLPLSIQFSDAAPQPQPQPISPSPIARPAQVVSAASPSTPVEVRSEALASGASAGGHGIRKVTSAIFAKVATLHSRRRSLLDDPLAQWGDLQGVDAQFDRASQVMKWIGREDPSSAKDALASAEDQPEIFAALMALLQTDGAGAVSAALRERTASSASTSRSLLALFQLSADPSLLPEVEALAASAEPDTRTLALTALAASGFVNPDRLIDLLDDPSDQIAARAAELLGWLGRSAGDAEVIQLRLRTDVPNGLRCSLLFASTALGSATALQDLRRMFDQDESVTAPAIDALAVAGGAEDAIRLLQLAVRQPDLAALAILAAGHLGSPAAVDAIRTTNVAEVSAAVIRRAQQTTLGSVAATKYHDVRLLYGAPWTTATALQRLTAPDELLQARSWYALEAAVRSGVRPGAVLDPRAGCAAQERAVDRIRAGLPPPRRSFRAGIWI